MKRTTMVGLAAAGVGALWLLRRRANAYSFRDKTVLITGGSRGLGLVLARQLAAEAARVAICARDQAEVECAGADLATYGSWPLALPCDVTVPEQVQGLVDAVESHFGFLDVLINNAGIISVGPLKTMTRQDFEDAMNVNYWGAYNAIEAALPRMRMRKKGRIVNICSIGGKIGIPHLTPYSASKFALAGYSEALRAELANNGITVTTVFPGLMRTGSARNATFKGQHRQEYAWFSISDSLPLITIGAERAARQIIDACRHGRAEIVLSLTAKVAVTLHALFPEVFASLLDVANRILPRPADAGTESHLGKESESFVSPSVLTTLNEQAARNNNEIAIAACEEE